MTQKNILYKKGLFIFALLSTPLIYGRADVTFSDSAGPIALDPVNGDLYVGLATGAEDASVTKISTDGVATSIATDADITGEDIRLLTLSMSGSTARPVVVDGTTNTTKFSVMSSDGSTFVISDALTDPGSATIAANGIRAIAASATKVYAAVADAAGATWATTGRGIAVRTITDGTLALSAAADAILINDADADDGTSYFSTGVGGGNAVANVQPALCYDSQLDRLYVGSEVVTEGTSGHAISVLIRDNAGAAVASMGDLSTGLVGETNIIATTGAAKSVSALNLGVMHTSTNHDYLIVNGGNGINTTVRNKVFAVPLVPATDATAAKVGTFAADSLTAAGSYTQSVTAADLCVAGDTHAIVGAGDAPFTADSNTTMQVVGDTVYLATQTLAVAANDECGIFSSTAQFNEHGKIVNWSRWTRVVPAEMGTSAINGDVHRFAIDAKRGKTFAIDGGTLTNLAISAWGEEATTTATDLATAVNADLTKGCYSILSLDRTVANFGNLTIGRLAIF